MVNKKNQSSFKTGKKSRRARQAHRVSFGEVYQEYLDGTISLNLAQKIGIFFLIVVLAGMVGWFYEVFINLVAHHEFYMKGGNFLPWMNIYAIGAIAVIATTYRVRKYPWAVFLIAAIVTGIVELIAGWAVYEIWPGTRYWDYTDVWWGFGNINGFVCPMSVLAFGLGSLVLMYALVPFILWLAEHINRKTFVVVASILFALIMTDELTNLTLKCLDEPTAMDFYRSCGLKYRG